MTMMQSTNDSRIFAVAAWTKNLIRRGAAKIALVFVLVLAAVSGFSQTAPIIKAATVIENTDNASTILKFLHFFSDYKGFQYLETDRVIDDYGQTISGRSALVYRFFCTDGDNTDVVFFVNQSGQIYQTKISRSTGVPFLGANFSIQVLGHLVANSDDKMTAEQRQRANELVNKADAHGLMDFWLALETL
jgi:hypothetical protein